MLKLLGGALLLIAGVACTRNCDVPGTTAVGPDSVIVTGGDTVVVTGGDSVVVTGGDSIAIAPAEALRTIVCKLMLRDKNPPTLGKKRIYIVKCAPRP
jgi:hypothetical protein